MSANHPGAADQLSNVSNFIQTAAVNGPRLVLIEPLSQGDRAFNSIYQEPVRGLIFASEATLSSPIR
jgi:hypothetical protein